ncbi:hypothetical protein OR16_04222 [Cupriavidus basilensis OR16]|uniref:Uncharacterized protein n=2 Tax=Cupriavidus basilensis TaxID=68895 RepID=H1RZT8_9BURK|nr:hypothetical protein OR16_04222 [Cupriavidus basilensis OR16]
MAVERHGNVFIIKRPSFNAMLLGRDESEAIPAMLKDGVLEIQEELGPTRLMVGPKTGHLLHAGAEYRRVGD